ncbi:unnamed protein product [Cladocopium goreaui]|uniref:Uncharacterized protein n=1 Tax=Cladocopium goreaui TaxID=2562237 RepID=A0A9P1DQM8_9DINO|nr:unnamed protein product [Cladocopium goreaui]CAI4014664.1 unnamed protein product [Cladocopium goreaui]
MSMAHDWRPCTCWVNAQLKAWMHIQPNVQLLLVAQLAQRLAEQLDCERGNCQLPVFEDLFPEAFTEKESDADKNRLWPGGFKIKTVPEEGDDLEDFEESDECQSRQSFDDGVGGGGIAQASAQHLLLTTDSKNDSEVPTLRCPPLQFVLWPVEHIWLRSWFQVKGVPKFREKI